MLRLGPPSTPFVVLAALSVGWMSSVQAEEPRLPQTERIQVMNPGKDTPVTPVLSRDGRHLYYIKELNTAGDSVRQAVFHYQLVDGELRLRNVMEVDTQFDELRVEVETVSP